MTDVCYACLELKNELIIPCGNNLCTGRICKFCINEQYKTNKQCGNCRRNIIVNQTVKIDIENCFVYYIKFLYLGLLSILGPITLILLMLGKTINYKELCKDVNLCKIDQLITIVLPLLSLMIYCFLIFICFILKVNSLYNIYKASTASYIFMLFFTITCHFIGSPILKKYWNIDEYFTWKTFCAGSVVYVMISIIGLIIFGSYHLIKYLKKLTLDKFIERNIEYGLTIKTQLFQ